MASNKSTMSNPLKNQSLKLKLKDIQMVNKKETDNDSNSRNIILCNQSTSPQLAFPLVSHEQTTEVKLAKMSNQVSLETINKIKPTDSQENQLLTSNNYRKTPERFFAVIKNQYNIENKVMNCRYYQSLTSFETKWIKELERISHNYRNKTDGRQILYDNETLSSLWKYSLQFDKYNQMKRIENRYAGTKYKSKLLPLKYQSKDNLNRFAKRFYYNKFILTEKMKLEEILNKITDHNNNE